jgi:hypothetical protein
MTSPPRRLTDRVISLLTLDTEPWLSCDGCFDLMDVYVETVIADPQTAAMEEMRVHLAGCPACAEEAESLLDLVAGNADPSAWPNA